ncbi:hypothetical protein ETB97_005862 [Aspergillus alliaceus]|uniref:UFSP1/2/DUB catalytic domain-containing protein n=1 Tax=Petromyces alliaceus TaxID=209559 RepID=A0A8H6EBQ3_PETAA|nr:hypothetical protein ETB97_005862 [Aspergillus burnettii]
MDHERAECPRCPFCSFSDPDSNLVVEHIALYHPDNSTYFDTPSGKKIRGLKQATSEQSFSSNHTIEHAGTYTDCPHGCGEILLATEVSTHLDLHLAEEVAYESTPSSLPKSSDSATTQKRRGIDDHDDLNNFQNLHGPPVKGQSKKEMLPQEPLKEKRPCSPSKVAITGGVKKLGRAELGPHAHEKQMPSWLRKLLQKGAKTMESNTNTPDGTLWRQQSFENETNDVIPVLVRLCEQDKTVQRAFFCSPNLQDMIENAWDMGFNSIGRIETGGIRGTRKYIGTPEAQALFLSLGIHANILVFDPMFKPSPAVKRLKGTPAVYADPTRILKGYRRGAGYLQKYSVFEILK